MSSCSLHNSFLQHSNSSFHSGLETVSKRHDKNVAFVFYLVVNVCDEQTWKSNPVHINHEVTWWIYTGFVYIGHFSCHWLLSLCFHVKVSRHTFIKFYNFNLTSLSLFVLISFLAVQHLIWLLCRVNMIITIIVIFIIIKFPVTDCESCFS